jgi:hypothetical protein
MKSTSEEDFELELRSLPGVMNVGITHLDNGDVDAVTLFVRDHDPETVRDVALHISSLYYPDATVSVENANGSHPEEPSREKIRNDSTRVALIWTDFNAKDGVSEVQLSYDGRVGIGLSGSGPLIGGAEATLAALRDLGYDIPVYLMSVTNIHTPTGWAVIVTFRSLPDDSDRIGIAKADGELVSSAKAALDALNRYVSESRLSSE